MREIRVQFQVDSYQRLKKWYLMPPCLTHRIIRYGSRVMWSNPGKGVAPSPTPWCSSYWKESFGSPSTKVANLLRTNILCFLFSIKQDFLSGHNFQIVIVIAKDILLLSRFLKTIKKNFGRKSEFFTCEASQFWKKVFFNSFQLKFIYFHF